MGSSFPMSLPFWGCWEPSDWSDSDDIDEVVNTKLLSFSNPQSGEGDGSGGGRSPWSLLCLLQFWPLGGQQGDSLWSEFASLGVSFWGESPCLSNLNGCGVNRFMHGCPGLPHLYLAFGYGPGQSPTKLLESLRGLWQDRPVYQPMCPPL